MNPAFATSPYSPPVFPRAQTPIPIDEDRAALVGQRATALHARRVIRQDVVPTYLGLLAAGAATVTGSAIALVLVESQDGAAAATGGMAAGMAAMVVAGVGLGVNTLAAWRHTRTVRAIDVQLRQPDQAADDRELFRSPGRPDAKSSSQSHEYPLRADQDCPTPPDSPIDPPRDPSVTRSGGDAAGDPD
ncbi:MAG: hypothetical protein RL522_2851 [Pseudomonadota bacterium]|jgi:hypothetical protein